MQACDHAYNVEFKVLNNKDVGLPQPRLRVYIVLIRKTSEVSNFVWPKGRTPGANPSLLKICDRDSNGKLVRGDLEKDKPKTATGLKQYTKGMQDLADNNLNPNKTNFIIDVGPGRARVNMRVDEVPTITSARAASRS